MPGTTESAGFAANPPVNKDDLRLRRAIGAIVRDRRNRMLILGYDKLNMLAVPVSKAASAEDTYVSRVNAAIADALPFVKRHEGFRPNAYRTVLGRNKDGTPIYDKWTIGYGQTSIGGRPVREGDVISESAASKFVADRLRQNAAALHRQNKWSRGLSQGGLSALYDTAYNTGVGMFSARRSPSLNAAMSAPGADTDAILRKELPTYSKAGGVKLRGLVNRRNDAIRRWLALPSGSDNRQS